MADLSGIGKRCYLGGPGTGKTAALKTHFLKALAEGKSVRWVLSTASLVEHIKDIVLSESDRRALVENRILTFDGWAREVLAPAETIVSAPVLLPWVEQILADRKPEGFARVLDLPGFAQSAGNAALEMIQAGVKSEDLRALADKGNRLDALADLVQALRSNMDDRALITPGQLVFRLAARLRSGEIELPDTVVLDGFYDFTCGQRACVQALAQAKGDLLLSLPADPDDLERPAVLSIRKTHELLKQCGFAFKRPPGAKAKRPSGPATLFSLLFTTAPSPAQPGMVRQAVGDTVEHLLETVAVEIANNRKKGELENWSQAGIVCRSLTPHANAVRRIFADHGIPVSIHGALDPGETDLGPVLLALLERLGAPPASTRVQKAQQLLQLVDLSACLREPAVDEQVRRRCSHQPDGGEGVRRKTPPLSLDDLAIAPIDPPTAGHLAQLKTWQKLARKDRCTAARFADQLRSLLRHVAKTHFRADHFGRVGIEEAGAVLRAFAAAADRIEAGEALLNLSPRSWSDHLNTLRRQLKETGLPLARRFRDAVHVVDVMEARSWVWRDVYVIGLVEGEFPRRIGENLYCRDAQRARLDPFLPTASSARAQEELLFSFTVSRATRSVTLGRHRLDETGKEKSPSVFIEEAQTLFDSPLPDVPGVRTLNRPVVAPAHWTVRSQARRAAAFAHGRHRHFDEGSDPDIAAGQRLYKKRLDGPGSQTPVGPGDDTLPESLLAGVKKRVEPFSVKVLETFIACPFRHFGQRLLRLRPPPEFPALDARLLGIIAHEVLAIYHRDRRQKNRGGALHALFRKVVKENLRIVDIGFDEKQDLDRLEGALRLMVDRQEQQWLAETGAEPVRFEWSFGTTAAPLEIQYDEAKEPFSGRIDRVDRLGGSLLILDYKLSKGAIARNDLKRLREGLLPQLPIYIAAVRQATGEPVTGALIEQVKQVRRSGFVSKSATAAQALADQGLQVLEEKAFNELIDQALSNLFALCAKIRTGRIAADPLVRKETCSVNRCDYYDLCRIDL